MKYLALVLLVPALYAQTLAPRQMITDAKNGAGVFSMMETLAKVHRGATLSAWVAWNQPDLNGVIFVQSVTGSETRQWKRMTTVCRVTCAALYLLTNAPAGTAKITVQFNITGPGVTYQFMGEEIAGP